MSHAAEAGVAALLFAIAGGSWLWSLRQHPYTRCRQCDGTGRNSGSTGRRYGRCRSCKGKPERLRFGARMFRGDQGDR